MWTLAWKSTCRYVPYPPYIKFVHKRSTFIIFLSKKMILLRKNALENIRHAQEKQKLFYYDKEHYKDKEKYTVGALVLVHNSRKLLRKGSRLEPNRSGPYVIHEDLQKGTYRLRDPDNPSNVYLLKSTAWPGWNCTMKELKSKITVSWNLKECVLTCL